MSFQKLISLFFKLFTWPFWHLQKLFPRNKNVWLFGSGEGYSYADNSKWLFEYVLKNHKEINAVWVTRSNTVYKSLTRENKPVVLADSIKGILTSLRAGIVFITNKPEDLSEIAINGAFHVYLWHGVMMKKIGLDANKVKIKKLSMKDKLRRFIYRSIYPERLYKPNSIINTAKFFTPFFKSAFNLKTDQVWISGYPRNDALFNPDTDNFITKINLKYNEPFKILYLPTWRSEAEGNEFRPFDSYGFNLNEFQKYLNDENAVFINKSHAFESKPLIENDSDRFINLENDDFEDLYLLMKDVDLLITDFSSVYFDFLLTGKPVILAPFDYENYVTNVKPLYYDYYKEIEGFKAENWGEVLKCLKNKTFYSVTKSDVSKYHKYVDQESSKRVVEQVYSNYLIN